MPAANSARAMWWLAPSPRSDAAGGAFLDARGIADFATQFPGIHAMLRGAGLDPARDLLPVATALHYAMGGVSTDLDGHTSRAGLWAAGEVACTGRARRQPARIQLAAGGTGLLRPRRP